MAVTPSDIDPLQAPNLINPDNKTSQFNGLPNAWRQNPSVWWFIDGPQPAGANSRAKYKITQENTQTY